MESNSTWKYCIYTRLHIFLFVVLCLHAISPFINCYFHILQSIYRAWYAKRNPQCPFRSLRRNRKLATWYEILKIVHEFLFCCGLVILVSVYKIRYTSKYIQWNFYKKKKSSPLCMCGQQLTFYVCVHEYK